MSSLPSTFGSYGKEISSSPAVGRRSFVVRLRLPEMEGSGSQVKYRGNEDSGIGSRSPQVLSSTPDIQFDDSSIPDNHFAWINRDSVQHRRARALLRKATRAFAVGQGCELCNKKRLWCVRSNVSHSCVACVANGRGCRFEKPEDDGILLRLPQNGRNHHERENVSGRIDDERKALANEEPQQHRGKVIGSVNSGNDSDEKRKGSGEPHPTPPSRLNGMKNVTATALQNINSESRKRAGSPMESPTEGSRKRQGLPKTKSRVVQNIFEQYARKAKAAPSHESRPITSQEASNIEACSVKLQQLRNAFNEHGERLYNLVSKSFNEQREDLAKQLKDANAELAAVKTALETSDCEGHAAKEEAKKARKERDANVKRAIAERNEAFSKTDEVIKDNKKAVLLMKFAHAIHERYEVDVMTLADETLARKGVDAGALFREIKAEQRRPADSDNGENGRTSATSDTIYFTQRRTASVEQSANRN